MIGAFLNKPYPYFRNVKRDLLAFFLIGTFVAFFLIFFQPFGLQDWSDPSKNQKLLGFGLVSFLIPALISFLVPLLFPTHTLEERWTVLKEILLILAVVLSIAFGNLLYTRILGFTPMSANAYLLALTFTFAISVFPVTLHVILQQNKFLKLSLEQSAALNSRLQAFREQTPGTGVQTETNAEKTIQSQTLHLVAENEKDEFSLEARQLLFIEAADNYVTIVFLEKDKRKKHLLRSSLKRIEGQIQVDAIIRCHRAYLVNLSNISKVEGNAAGYRVFFEESEESIPVSRNYIAAFKERLNALK